MTKEIMGMTEGTMDSRRSLPSRRQGREWQNWWETTFFNRPF